MKCKVVSFVRKINSDFIYNIPRDQQCFKLVKDAQITDLRVILDSRLSYSDHIQSKVNKCYSVLGIIKRNFRDISVAGYVLLYKSIVRSHLNYCNSVWAPLRKEDIEELEKVQRKATKWIPGLRRSPIPKGVLVLH